MKAVGFRQRKQPSIESHLWAIRLKTFLSVLQVEVFQYALDSTSGEDLHRVLWLKSRNSEVWLDRRTNYTRSCAVMSMVSTARWRHWWAPAVVGLLGACYPKGISSYEGRPSAACCPARTGVAPSGMT